MPLAAIRSRFAPLTSVAASAVQDAPPEGECCVTCGRPAGTPFCPHCGERRAADRPLRLRELGEELWGSFVSVDGRVVRSFWTLARHPGALTEAYVRGERRRYLTPLGVFFTVNALYFVLATAHGWGGFTAPLNSHLHVFDHQTIAQRLVGARLAQRHVSLATYASAFDAVAASQGRTLLLALVPLFAACNVVVQFPNRRPALQHVAFALHAISVLLLLSLIEFYVLRYGALAFFGIRAVLTHTHGTRVAWDVPENVFVSALGLAFFAWLAPAVRRSYGGGWVPNLIRAAVLVGSIAPALAVYRVLLFFTAFWAT